MPLPLPLSLLTTHTCPCWTPFSNNNNNSDSSSASSGRDNELSKQITRTSFSAAMRRVTARLPLPLPLPSLFLPPSWLHSKNSCWHFHINHILMCRIAFCTVRESRNSSLLFRSDFVCSFVYLFAICCRGIRMHWEREVQEEEERRRERKSWHQRRRDRWPPCAVILCMVTIKRASSLYIVVFSIANSYCRTPCTLQLSLVFIYITISLSGCLGNSCKNCAWQSINQTVHDIIIEMVFDLSK